MFRNVSNKTPGGGVVKKNTVAMFGQKKQKTRPLSGKNVRVESPIVP